MQISINLNGTGQIIQGITLNENKEQVWKCILLKYINPESFEEGQELEEGIHCTKEELFTNINFVKFIEQTKEYLTTNYPESLQTYLDYFKLDSDLINF